MDRNAKSKPKSHADEEISVLSKDPDAEGFDLEAGETWVYPTNYSLREYQHSIIEHALFNNTMVSLPTGLGKTFIAAVVMYNFYRWYPTGKTIFMAPTRPLVKQQIDACYNIMAIPKEVTAELTGTKVQTFRKEVWKEKRVFFVTPQVLQNDLGILNELGTKIKCIVFDEAHKAKGNHAYCEVIRKLHPQNKYFRVLALSATPGSSLNDVFEVIHNLLISHLEVRTDDSPDVLPYIFKRSLETVVVPLGGKLQEVRDSYMQILEKYTRLLIQHRVITGNCSMLTKGKIFMTMKDYQEKHRTNRDRTYSEIMRNLNICITLYHAYELLIRHGLRGFLSFFEEHAEKPLLRGNGELREIMQDVGEYLGPAPNVEPLPDGTIMEISESSKFGHPKFYKLRDILVQHFTEATDNSSRVIVFCEYRESVMEAYALMLRHKPLVKPKIFLGQGAITQKQQISVIKAFKQGECNTLISTCIGEEGLDIGEVDLIICFDISTKSPVRMVQRMGRTGRKRQGRVVILVTEGKEQQTLKECLIHKENLNNHILQSSALHKQMYAQNPRMVPAHITPNCHKMFITVKADNPQVLRKKGSSLLDMFSSMSRKKSDSSLFTENCDIELLETVDRLPEKQEYWRKKNPLQNDIDKSRIDFSKKIGKLRILQPTGRIGHARNLEVLVSLLQFAESKRYNIPITQAPIIPSQVTQPTEVAKVANSEGLKQADIRKMFLKPPSRTEFITKDQDDKILSQENKGLFYDKQILALLHTEIANYLDSVMWDETDNCKVCTHLFSCNHFIKSNQEFSISTWVEPDASIFKNLNTESLTKFADSLKAKPQQLIDEQIDTEYVKDKGMTVSPHNILEGRIPELNFNHSGLKHSPFKPPNNIQRMLKKCSIPLSLNDTAFNNVGFTQIESLINSKPSENHDNILCTLNVDAFDEAEFTQIKTDKSISTEIKNQYKETYNDTLSFFNINALEELFEAPCVKTPCRDLHQLSSTPRSLKPLSDSQETIIYSPSADMISNLNNSSLRIDAPMSPVLGSGNRRKQLQHRTHKRLFEYSMQNNGSSLETSNKSCLEQTWKTPKKNTSFNRNFSGDIFDQSDELWTVDLLPQTETAQKLPENSNTEKTFETAVHNKKGMEEENYSEDLEPDVIDTSLTEFESVVFTQIANKPARRTALQSEPLGTDTECKKENLSINDMFDLSVFGLSTDNHKGAKQPENSTEIQGKISNIDDNQKIAANLNLQTKQVELENKCNIKNSAVSILHDFCDGSFLDMFFEKEPLQENKSAGNSNELEKTSNKITSTVSKSSKISVTKSHVVPSQKGLMFHKEWKDKVLHNQEQGIHQNSALIEKDNLKKNQTNSFQVLAGSNYKKTVDEPHENENNEWKEDSIWDFCVNRNNNKVTETDSLFALLNKRKTRSSENRDKNSTLQEKENKLIDAEDKSNKYEQLTRNLENDHEIVDLTADSPIKCKSNLLNSSSVLTKTQGSKRNQISQKLNFWSQDNESNLNNLDRLSQINSNTATQKSEKNIKKKTTSKLQLNTKSTQSSIASMTWFKKSNEILHTSSNNNSSSKRLNSRRNSAAMSTDTNSTLQASKIISVPENPELRDENFDFTFNMKTPQKPISLVRISSPINKAERQNNGLQTIPEKLKSRLLNTVSDNSDDSDFDLEFSKKTVEWIKPKPKNFTEKKSLISKHINRNLSIGENPKRAHTGKSTAKKKLTDCSFLDLEAEVSTDEHSVSESDCEEIDCDKFEESFVDDLSQNIGNNTTMHAHYLQSVRSPVAGRGKFKIPLKSPITANVYSQLVDNTENSYVNDSFCVNTEDMELSQQHTADMSELELAEMILEQKRKSRKRKKSKGESNVKRRRILQISSDSD